MRLFTSSTAPIRASLLPMLTRTAVSSFQASSSVAALFAASPKVSGRALRCQIEQRRSLFGMFEKKTKAEEELNSWNKGKNAPAKPILEQNNLFHPLSTSPIPDLRARAERIKRVAPCPVYLRRGQMVNVNFDCPDCGWPTHHSEKEWREDEEHGRYVLRLREANEDEHDLRSGRQMNEFRMPGPQGFEEAINFSSWDVFFYTRNFPSIEKERSRRHVSKMLTFPASMAGVLHENSPYTTRNRRMTREGVRSFLALRQMLHPMQSSKPSLDSLRAFVVGARAESTLPTTVWDQLRFMFPGVNFHIHLIGPEVTLPSLEGGPGLLAAAKPHKTRPSRYGPRAPSKTIVVSEGLTITYIQSTYEEVHHQMEPFDPYTDVFFAFSPGFGFPSQKAYQPVTEAGVARPSSSQHPTAKASVAAEPRLDAVAARFESREEVQSPQQGASSAQEKLPNASSTIQYQHREGTEPVKAGSAQSAAPASGASHSKKAAATVAPTNISQLPTLPPLLQAQAEWAQALTQMLSTKCPIVVTGFSPADVRRDVEAFESVEGIMGEFEWLVTPGENVFGSLSWSIADFDPRVAVKANWGVWAVRGKRYDLQGPSAFVNLYSTRQFNEEGE